MVTSITWSDQLHLLLFSFWAGARPGDISQWIQKVLQPPENWWGNYPGISSTTSRATAVRGSHSDGLLD